ncbi:Calcineurin-like phosphoesterase [Halopenitus malekzadehii]|uniref:Calcineurin-like phosphoesterase n=1 Tax=Halopenitus malekzadehii TaxID=1267564 RepID=A0A1H6JIG0_9EURY|nr:metallophosphoesterase [Halopenitus malekzadehii]SEH58912.1 Calcineurin-like phosphoesterase [Halopenitus malekzadehii]
MTTSAGLRHNQGVKGPVAVTVRTIDTDPEPPRDVELIATDADGEELQVVLWETHDVTTDWRPDSTYEIWGGRAKRYIDASGPELRIHSNADFTVKRVPEPDTCQVLVVGDTHVGYRHRASSTKPGWAHAVDNRRTFTRSLARARALDVDAVVHAGDVFDHRITQVDKDHVRKEIQWIHDVGIPLYFIHGNHDNEAGNETLRQGPGIHLGGKTMTLGRDSVHISGLDYGAGEFSGSLPEAVAGGDPSTSILVLHDTPYPAVDETGSPIHRNDPNHLDLRDFLDRADEWLDLIVSGHMHVGSRGSIAGYETPLLVTGPTAEISKSTRENQPSTWLVTISEEAVQIERQKLS